MRETDFVDKLAFIMISGYSIFTFIRGLFWFVEDDNILKDSEFYTALNNIFPIWIWGLIIMVASIILFIGAWLIPNVKYSNTCQRFLLIGGISICIIYFLMTSASMFNAINWLSWAQFAVLTAKSGAIAFIGGTIKYDRRK